MTWLKGFPQNEYPSDFRQHHPKAWVLNYFNSIWLHEAITNKLSSSSLCVFVWFNLLRHQTPLVIENVLSPYRISRDFFYDRIKLSYPQLGESYFPGVNLFKLFFYPTTPHKLIRSFHTPFPH